MIRESSKKLVDPAGDGLYREVTIKLTQHYHDNTKKLIKTEEGERVEGRLFRRAEGGEKADTQLMDSASFEVLPLVEVAEKAKAPESPPLPPAPEPEPVSEPEPDEQVQEDPPSEEPEEEEDSDEADADETSDAVTDEGNENEDDMAAKKKTKKKVTKKKKVQKKASAKKAPAKKAATKGAAASGQSGPEVDLSAKKVNPKEKKVLEALNHGKGPQKILDLGSAAFKSAPKAKQNSWTRNSLRRLVRGGLVEQVSRGTYALTTKGKKFKPTDA